MSPRPSGLLQKLKGDYMEKLNSDSHSHSQRRIPGPVSLEDAVHSRYNQPNKAVSNRTKKVVTEATNFDQDVEAIIDEFVKRYIVHDSTPGVQTFVDVFHDALANAYPQLAGMGISIFSKRLRKALRKNNIEVIDGFARKPWRCKLQAVLKNVRLNPLTCGSQM